ncbi:MAG: EAL domain-containing protein [Chloroflexota bacterium]|nr:EAL domain-containing protein [Chloroflexota bacterium]
MPSNSAATPEPVGWVLADVDGAQPRLVRWRLPLIALAVVFIGLVAAYGIATLRTTADERREGELLLTHIESMSNLESALQWQAISQAGLAEDLGDQVRDSRARAILLLEALSAIEPDGAAISRLEAALQSFESAVNGVLERLAARDVEAANAVASARVNAAYQDLVRVLEQERVRHRAVADDTNDSANIGALSAAISAVVLITLLFRKFDRSQRRVAELAGEREGLRQSEERFRSLVQNSSDIVIVVSGDGTVLYQSSSGERLLGHPSDDVRGMPMLELVHSNDRRTLQAFLAQATGSQAAKIDLPAREWRMRRGDGGWLHVEATARNLLDEPTVRGLVINARDVGERKALEAELSHRAFHDPLTGLPNRALFLDRLGHALTGRSGSPVAVLFIDLDEFKIVNDRLGHAAGDHLLTVVAGRLRDLMRPQDTAARLGGDEFGVILEDASEEQARRIADRLLEALTKPTRFQNHDVVTGASIGVACTGSVPHDADELIKNADAAMYVAKGQGRQRVVTFEPDMRSILLQRHEFVARLQRAIDTQGFVLHYQPIVSLDSGRIESFEALIRWRRGGRLVLPSTFIPTAEETGMILPIGRWVMQEACSQASRWGRESVGVSVNVSARQLQDSTVVGTLAGILSSTGMDPSRLTLEITEGGMVQDGAAGLNRLAELRSLGVRVSIDDFGTGYSSLSYLRRLPLDELKIDQSFIDGLATGTPEATLVGAIVRIGADLGLQTVAEGIERADQHDLLRGLGCGLGQGHHFSRPTTASRAREIIAAGSVQIRDAA